MNNKILFMIYNNEIKLMTSENADHWKWYQTIGGDPNNYDNIVRGFITDEHVLFFKSNYKIDEEVLDRAKTYGPLICRHLNKPNTIIGCGLRQEDGKVKPEQTITKEEIERYKIEKAQKMKEDYERRQREENIRKAEELRKKESIIEFKNNQNDDKFVKYAITFTIIILVLSIISKIYLISSNKLLMSNRWNSALVIIQIVSLVASIIFYKKKSKTANYTSLIATTAMYATFNLSELIIGTINLLFTIDQQIIVKAFNCFKNLLNNKKKLKKNLEKK